MHCETNFDSLSLFSICCGAMYLPPEVLLKISFFFRSVNLEKGTVKFSDITGVQPAVAIDCFLRLDRADDSKPSIHIGTRR